MAKASIQFTLNNSADVDVTAVLIPPAIQRTEGFKGRFLNGTNFKDISGTLDISVSGLKVNADPMDLNMVPSETNVFEVVGDVEKPLLSKIQQFTSQYDVAILGAAIKSANGEQFENGFATIVDLPFVDAYKKQAIAVETDANGGQSYSPTKGLICKFVNPVVLNAANRDTGLIVTLEAKSAVTITLDVEFHTAASPKQFPG